VPVLLSLDIGAAVDMIDHIILLQLPERVIGIKGRELGWFKSYLFDRFQFVHVNDGLPKTPELVISHGVLQGPVLVQIF